MYFFFVFTFNFQTYVSLFVFRDFLRQQEEVIDKLNNDLAQERVDKQELLHGRYYFLSAS